MDERGPDLVDRTNNETDKDDDSPPVTESPPCTACGLNLPELQAQHSMGGHHVITHWTEGKPRLRQGHCTQDPSLWLLCADSPARGLPCPCRGERAALPAEGFTGHSGRHILWGAAAEGRPQPKKGRGLGSPILPTPPPFLVLDLGGPVAAGGSGRQGGGGHQFRGTGNPGVRPEATGPAISYPLSGGTMCNC